MRPVGQDDVVLAADDDGVKSVGLNRVEETAANGAVVRAGLNFMEVAATDERAICAREDRVVDAAGDDGFGGIGADAVADAAADGREERVRPDAVEVATRDDGIVRAGLDGIEVAAADGRAKGAGFDGVVEAAGDDGFGGGGVDGVALAAANRRERCVGPDGVVVAATNDGMKRAGQDGVEVAATDERPDHIGLHSIIGRAADEVGQSGKVWLEPQAAHVIDFNFERLVVRGAEKIHTGGSAGVAFEPPGIEVGQPRPVAAHAGCGDVPGGEITRGIAFHNGVGRVRARGGVGRARAGGHIRGGRATHAGNHRRALRSSHVARQRTDQVGGRGRRRGIVGVVGDQRMDRIRRGGQPLARGERGETAAAVGCHLNRQPAVRAGELIAEIQQDGEQAVADRRGDVGQRAADLGRAADGVEQREGEVVAAVGGSRAVVQPALVSEGRALRWGDARCGQPQGDDQQGTQGSFHTMTFCLVAGTGLANGRSRGSARTIAELVRPQ